MSATYTRMALVRPDLLESKTTLPLPTPTLPPPPPTPQLPDAQSAFYESQLVRERLTPDTSLVNILSHLQKRAYNVLHDESLKSSDKLSVYNQLMVQSSIMLKKAKAIGRAAASMNPTTVRRKLTVAKKVPAVKKRRLSESSLDLASDSENDNFEYPQLPDTDDDELEDTATGGTYEDDIQEQNQFKEMDFNIDRHIPTTYSQNAKKLYKLLAEKGRGLVNWNRRGELVVDGNTIEKSNIIELLSDAARPKSKMGKAAPVGRNIFVKVVKRLNPTLKHVKNKQVFATSRSRSSSLSRRKNSPAKKKASKAQTGSGLKIVWRTKL